MRMIIKEYVDLNLLTNDYTQLDEVCDEIASIYSSMEDNVLVIKANGRVSVTEDFKEDDDIASLISGDILLLSQLGVEFTISIEINLDPNHN